MHNTKKFKPYHLHMVIIPQINFNFRLRIKPNDVSFLFYEIKNHVRVIVSRETNSIKRSFPVLMTFIYKKIPNISPSNSCNLKRKSGHFDSCRSQMVKQMLLFTLAWCNEVPYSMKWPPSPIVHEGNTFPLEVLFYLNTRLVEQVVIHGIYLIERVKFKQLQVGINLR